MIERCKKWVWRRGWHIHQFQCRRPAGPSGYCWQHKGKSA